MGGGGNDRSASSSFSARFFTSEGVVVPFAHRSNPTVLHFSPQTTVNTGFLPKEAQNFRLQGNSPVVVQKRQTHGEIRKHEVDGESVRLFEVACEQKAQHSHFDICQTYGGTYGCVQWNDICIAWSNSIVMDGEN